MDNKKKQSWLLRLVKGIIIALGFILPGVSGGVLAAILGIYERLLSFMAHLTENFKENFLFFLPVGIGGIIGIGLLSRPLEFLLAHYQVIVLWGFSGAIVGTLPSLIKEATLKKERDRTDWIWLIATMIIGFLLLFFMGDIFGTLPANFATFILAGGLIALGILVPGLSPSNLLLVLGLYHPMLSGFRAFDIVNVFLPITIGGVIAVLIFSKTMNRLLKTHHSRVYHFIIGLVIASTVLIVLPPVVDYSDVTIVTIIVSAVLFFGGCILGAWMSKLEEKYK